MIKNVLITGGAGFIGSHLALKLIKNGFSITVLDNLSKQIHGEDSENSYLYKTIINKVKFIKGDVTNQKDWELALPGQEAVIHLAAETGTGQSMYEIYKYSDVNIGGTALLLDILANSNHSIKKLIIASSRAIYGEGRYTCDQHGEVYPSSRKERDLLNGDFECKCPICNSSCTCLPTHENSKINPQSIYGISKNTQEQLFLTAGKALNIPTIAYRYQNVYGPGQSLLNPYTGILSIFSTQMKNNTPINVFEDGKETRDFVYIEDVVDATMAGLVTENAEYESYNVGSGSAITVYDIAKKLAKVYNSEVPINITGNFRLGDIRNNVADLTKIKNHLNFSPQYSFENGISHFAAWVNKQDVSQDKSLQSINELKSRGLFK